MAKPLKDQYAYKVDHVLSDKIEKEGGYSTRLSWADRQRLRSIVKKVHMKHYPTDMLTDKEADRIIDVIAPGTAEYLVKHHLEKQAFRRTLK